MWDRSQAGVCLNPTVSADLRSGDHDLHLSRIDAGNGFPSLPSSRSQSEPQHYVRLSMVAWIFMCSNNSLHHQPSCSTPVLCAQLQTKFACPLGFVGHCWWCTSFLLSTLTCCTPAADSPCARMFVVCVCVRA